MGLISKIKSSVGQLQKVKGLGAIAGRLKDRVTTKSVNKVIGFSPSAISTRVKAAGIGISSSPLTAASYLQSKAAKQKKAFSMGLNPAQVKGGASLASKLKTGGKIAAVGALAAAAIYGGEQIAEKLGVRGGAGFIGKRPKSSSRKRRKKKRASSSTRRSRRRSYGRRVSFTTKDGRRVSFTPGRKRSRRRLSSLSYRRKRGRRGTGVSKTEFRKLKAMVRRFERD